MHGSDPLDLQVVRGDECADEEHAEDAKTPSADDSAKSAKTGLLDTTKIGFRLCARCVKLLVFWRWRWHFSTSAAHDWW
jgi:hypothetical protein